MNDDDAWRMASSRAQTFIRERFSAAAVWSVLADSIDSRPYPDVDARRVLLESKRTR
jgi:hypothetical protein